MMAEKEYQLYAWTDKGAVRYSNPAFLEQEALLQDDFYIPESSDELSWEEFERLAKVAWQWGMLLLSMKDWRGAYSRFVDGIHVCLEAIRRFKVGNDGGVHPFLLAIDDLYAGCNTAACEDVNVEEIFCEDGIHDIRRLLWNNMNFLV